MVDGQTDKHTIQFLWYSENIVISIDYNRAYLDNTVFIKINVFLIFTKSC